MENTKGLATGDLDCQGNKIYYETSKLKLPNGTIGKVVFDTGQLAAYFAYWEDSSYIVGIDGVNNHKSFYLRDCEVITKSNIARKVILDELIENTHPEKVEDVIFWALEEYCKNRKTNGSLIAFSIKERILEAEKGRDDEFLNPETVNSVFP